MVVTKFALQFQICSHLSDQGWIGMEPCAPEVTGYDPGCPVSPEYVDPSYCFYFYLSILGFHRQKAPEVHVQDSAFWF